MLIQGHYTSTESVMTVRCKCSPLHCLYLIFLRSPHTTNSRTVYIFTTLKCMLNSHI